MGELNKLNQFLNLKEKTLIFPNLLLIEKLVFKPAGLMIQNLNVADESADYEAAEFTIDTRLIKW